MAKIMRLPKTFEHWCRSIGLDVVFLDHDGYAEMRTNHRSYRNGCLDHYRRFRVVGARNVIQICDGYFDRWANSVGAEVPLGQSRADFENAVRQLVDTANLSVPSREDETTNIERKISWINRELSYALDDHAYYNSIYKECVAYGYETGWIKKIIARSSRALAMARARLRSEKQRLKRLNEILGEA